VPEDRVAMHGLFNMLVALGLVLGGFWVTGDLSRCLRWLERSGGVVTVAPWDASGEDASADDTFADDTSAHDAYADDADDEEESESAAAGEEAIRSGSVRVAPRRPSAGGLERIDLTSLPPGSRLFVWWGRGMAQRCLAVDLVDPATGEALVHRADATGDSSPQRMTVAGAGRTGLLGSAAPRASAVLERGGMLRMQPLGLAHGRAAAVDLHGPITGLAAE
jgi:hypothetical protein